MFYHWKLNIIIFLLMVIIAVQCFFTLAILDTSDENSENMINACAGTLGNE